MSDDAPEPPVLKRGQDNRSGEGYALLDSEHDTRRPRLPTAAAAETVSVGGQQPAAEQPVAEQGLDRVLHDLVVHTQKVSLMSAQLMTHMPSLRGSELSDVYNISKRISLSGLHDALGATTLNAHLRERDDDSGSDIDEPDALDTWRDVHESVDGRFTMTCGGCDEWCSLEEFQSDHVDPTAYRVAIDVVMGGVEIGGECDSNTYVAAWNRLMRMADSKCNRCRRAGGASSSGAAAAAGGGGGSEQGVEGEEEGEEADPEPEPESEPDPEPEPESDPEPEPELEPEPPQPRRPPTPEEQRQERFVARFRDNIDEESRYADLLNSLADEAEGQSVGAEAWGALHGMQGVKDEIVAKFVTPIGHRADLPAGTVPTGLMLYGPGGCGKSSLVRGIAAELKLGFLPIESSLLRNDAQIQAVFQHVRDAGRVLVFIDEAEALLGSAAAGKIAQLRRSADPSAMLPNRVHVVIATNEPWKLTAAGIDRRFATVSVHVALPDATARVEILRRCFAETPQHTIEADQAALELRSSDMERFSPLEVRQLAAAAITLMMNRGAAPQALRSSDLQTARDGMRGVPKCSAELQQRYLAFGNGAPSVPPVPPPPPVPPAVPPAQQPMEVEEPSMPTDVESLLRAIADRDFGILTDTVESNIAKPGIEALRRACADHDVPVPEAASETNYRRVNRQYPPLPAGFWIVKVRQLLADTRPNGSESYELPTVSRRPA